MTDDWKGEHLIRVKPRREMTMLEKQALSNVDVARMVARRKRAQGIKPAITRKHAAFVQAAMGWQKTPVRPPRKVEE